MSQGNPIEPLSDLYGDLAERLRGDRWQPDVDVFETASAIVVRAEIAGIAGGDLRVTVDADVLCIAGQRRPPQDPDVKRLHQMEIATGPFERRLRIPTAIDRDRVTAHLAEGFLTVTLPKSEPQRVPVAREGTS